MGHFGGLSGRLSRVLGRLECVLRPFGCLLRDALGGVLGASWGLLWVFRGEFQAPLRPSWGVLWCFGASSGCLGLDFRSEREVD